MGKNKTVKYIPPESQTFASRNEVSAFDDSTRKGESIIRLRAEKKHISDGILKNQDKAQQLKDFIFGKTSENPLDTEEIQAINKKIEVIENREKKDGVVGITPKKPKGK